MQENAESSFCFEAQLVLLLVASKHGGAKEGLHAYHHPDHQLLINISKVPQKVILQSL